MLDPRLYRAAFAPLLLGLVIAAFSLVDRPRPLQTTLAPDAFDGPRAFQTLQRLAALFPDRRPGSAGDDAVAASVERSLRGSFCNRGAGCSAVVVRRFSDETIDGGRTLETVIATRLGEPGPGIVVVAHRDAARRGSAADLSGTAALVELARVFGGRQTRRTLTLVSTSGGSGGAAGAAQLASDLPSGDPHPDAVIVLGDLASDRVRRPLVLPWSTGSQFAPDQLRRTAEAAVRTETAMDAGGAHPWTQVARLAFPFGLGEEAPLNAAGVPAVALSVSGERGPPADAPVSENRLRLFGRAALRTIDSLDNGPDLRAGPGRSLLVLGKVLPGWAMRLVVALLLLPVLVGGIDALARVRRRHAPVAVWLRWIAGLVVPFALALALARVLGALGMLPAAPHGAVVAGRVGANGIALAVVALTFVLGWLALRSVHQVLAVPILSDGPGPVAALAVAIGGLAWIVWLVNPFAAAVLVLPAHLWLVVPAPETRLRRAPSVALVLGALLPALLVVAVYASAVGASPLGLPWSLLLLVAGGQVSLLSLLVLSLLGGCAVAAVRLALRPREEESAPALAAPIFGPIGYVEQGSLTGAGARVRVRR